MLQHSPCHSVLFPIVWHVQIAAWMDLMQADSGGVAETAKAYPCPFCRQAKETLRILHHSSHGTKANGKQCYNMGITGEVF